MLIHAVAHFSLCPILESRVRIGICPPGFYNKTENQGRRNADQSGGESTADQCSRAGNNIKIPSRIM